MPRKRVPSILAALLIATYFIILTRDALLCYFSPDDCMNMYRSWQNSVAALLKANFLFFLNSPFYRPMGSAWYRSMFELAGFNPVAFHISNLLMLGANIWLTYCVARRLTGSRTAGGVAALLIAYHGRFISLYFDTGYIYDVLCYFFYFATLAFYLRVRSRPGPPKWWEMVVVSALYICAMNAKEMAVTLPISLLAYELIYHRDAISGLRNIWRWSMAEGRAVLVTGILTFTFVVGRAITAPGLLDNPAFQPVFRWHRFVETSVNFVSVLFFRDKLLPSAMVIGIWLALLAIAWISKSRALKFAWLFLMLTALPVAFIPPRGPAQYYINYFGWVLYAAIVLVEITRRLLGARWVRDPLLILCVAAVMYRVNRPYTWRDVSAVAVEGEELRVIVDQLHQLRPTLRKGARLLFLNDPIDDEWRMQTLVSMSYRDPDLEVDRVRYMQRPPAASEFAAYDSVFDYRHGHFYPFPLPKLQGPQPEIVYERGYPAVFHTDWSPVTHLAPAKAGETVISMVEDLGETIPPVPYDRPFPTDPFAEVASPVEVRVDGQPAEVLNKFGWPDRVNRYRVDFRIPENVRRGEPEVVITGRGYTGLPTRIPVR